MMYLPVKSNIIIDSICHKKVRKLFSNYIKEVKGTKNDLKLFKYFVSIVISSNRYYHHNTKVDALRDNKY